MSIRYSVFSINNSEHILNNIETEIKTHFSKKFSQMDSVYIFRLSATCEITRYGYARNEEEDVIVV